MLAVRTSWSRDEIMAMPAAEFAYYAATLIEMSNPEEHDV